jgi:hypothetical protein
LEWGAFGNNRMTIPLAQPRPELFEQNVFDDHIAELGQVCLHVPVRRCACVVQSFSNVPNDPDPDCNVCNGVGIAEISYADLPEFEYQQVGVKDSPLGELIFHTIGLELLDNTRIRIEGDKDVAGVPTPTTFVFGVDFNLIAQANDDRGAIHINWLAVPEDQPITNKPYKIIYTMKQESLAIITGNVFNAKLTQWEAGLWQDGDVKVTPAALSVDTRAVPWTRIPNLLYDVSINDQMVLWNSRHAQVEHIKVPNDNILDLKHRYLVEVIRVHKMNPDNTAIIDITPSSINALEGKVTLPSGSEGEFVVIKYTHRPVYQAYYENPMMRAHELGKSLPKYIIMRPVDMLTRDDKQEVL